MKKQLFLLVSALLLYGCGGGSGGGTAASNSGNGGGNGTGTVASAAFKLTINEDNKSAAAKTSDKQVFASIPTTTANFVRIVFSDFDNVTIQVPVYDPNTDKQTGTEPFTSSTLIYKKVIDVPNYVPGSSVTVSVPASDPVRGYVVDVLTYYDDGSQHYNILKYAHNPLVVVASGGSATINASAINPTFTVPSPVNPESKYTANFTAPSIGGVSPLSNSYKLRQDLGTDVSFPSFSGYTTVDPNIHYYGVLALTSPTILTASDSTLYLSAQCFINDSLLGGNKNENFANWTMISTGTTTIKGVIPVTVTP